MVNNKKIICKHCGEVIGFIHKLSEGNYLGNTIISPNKYSFITKVKIRGDMYTDHNENIGYSLETQLKCNKCNKKTTIKEEDYLESGW